MTRQQAMNKTYVIISSGNNYSFKMKISSQISTLQILSITKIRLKYGSGLDDQMWLIYIYIY